VGHNAVELIMRELGIKGLPTRRRPRNARLGQVVSLDLVRRSFRRDRPNELWFTDITEHPTREGKLYCCVVLDAFSRLVVGWSIEPTQTTLLVLNALGMATQRREHRDGLVIHSDRGVQFSSWAFSQRVRDAGIAPSIGAVGSCFDHAMMEAFWARMQVELLNRRRGTTRVGLATAIHDYIEHFHNNRRRHSALGMRTPAEVEAEWFRQDYERGHVDVTARSLWVAFDRSHWVHRQAPHVLSALHHDEQLVLRPVRQSAQRAAPAVDRGRRDLLEPRRAESGQQMRAQVRAVVAQRRGLAAAVVLGIAHELGGRIGERRAGANIPGSDPRRASSSTDRSASSASRFVK
jgi:transposase InsO family protein